MSAPIDGAQFYQEHPNFRPQLEGMGKRVIVELFLKIVCNFWRTLGSYFLNVPLSEDTRALYNEETARKLAGRGGDGPIVLSELEHKRTIGPTSVKEYAQTVLLPQNENLAVVTNFMFNANSSNLPEVDDTKNLIFVPTVLKSGIRDHIVAVVFDREANRIELYDSKGLVALDRDEYVSNQDQLMLIDVLQKVVDQYGDADAAEETTIWENTEKHQKDSHNCGVYVLNYIERRLGGESAEQIAAAGLSFTEVNNSCRDELLRQYLMNLPEPPPPSENLMGNVRLDVSDTEIGSGFVGI